jgi:hypothetical protein
MVTTAVNQFSGPAYVFIGDPTVALGAGLVNLGLLPNVSVRLLLNRQSALNEIGQPLADGQWGGVVGATCALTMHEKSASILAALINEVSSGSAAIPFSPQYAKLTADSICVMPIAGKGSGVTYAGNIWIPKAVPDDVGEFVYKVMGGAGAQDDSNPYTVNFRATLDATCNSKYQILWMGSPVNAGKTYLLPSGY